MLQLHEKVYSVEAIRETVATFADFGTFSWNEDAADGYFQIEIEAGDDVDPIELVGEFGNFALARSIEAMG